MRSILLSDHFNSRKLLRFTYPSILMMLATSVQSTVDGIFVSNYAGTTPFAEINFVMPVLSILGIWASVAVAEFMAAAVGVTLTLLLRKRYGY